MLADLVIDEREAAELEVLAADLGLGAQDVHAAHGRYLDGLVTAAMRDRIVTPQEELLLTQVATALGLSTDRVEADVEKLRPTAATLQLETGLRVCFTGTAQYPDGTELSRSRLNEIARNFDLVPVESVSKKGCDLLVAADPLSQSGKAAKARQFGIPVTSVSDFLLADRGARVPVVS